MRTLHVLLMAAHLFCLLPQSVSQDIINKKNGESVICNVIDVGSTHIMYKAPGDAEGSLMSVPKSEVISIVYEDGRRVYLEKLDVGLFSNEYDHTASVGYDRAILIADGESIGAHGIIFSYETRPADWIGWRVPLYLLISEGVFVSVSTGINPKIYLNESNTFRVFIGPEVNLGYVPDLQIGEAFFLGGLGFSLNLTSRLNLTLFPGVGYYMVFNSDGAGGTSRFRLAATAGVNF